MENRVLVIQEFGKNSVPMLNNMKVVPDTETEDAILAFSPTHVVFEDLVEPLKLTYLTQHYPAVKWLVQITQGLAELADNLNIIDRLIEYVHFDKVAIAVSSQQAFREVRTIIKAANPSWSYPTVNEKVLYLPTYYPHPLKSTASGKKEEGSFFFFDIACFDCSSTLLVQAIAAIEYANMTGKTLRLHVGGEPVDSNVEALFAVTPHELVRHPWMSHTEFLSLLKTMDVAMQVSDSESFNVVAADCVVAGLPVVVSSDVNWVTSWCQADCIDSEDILLKLVKTDDWRLKKAMRILNLRGLRHFCENSHSRWIKYLSE